MAEDQIAQLLRRPAESLNVEIKTWFDPRQTEGISKLVKAIFSIRNRNGGFLVIGYDDDKLIPDEYNLEESVDELFHPDYIQGIVSRYSNIVFPVDVDIREHSGQRHPIIRIPDGVKVPAVVKRDLVGDGGKRFLSEGDVYFRTLNSNGTPSSAKLLPTDFSELIEICFENREADIGRFLRRQLASADLAKLTDMISVLAETQSAAREEGLTKPEEAPARTASHVKSEAFSVIESGEAAFKEALIKRPLPQEHMPLLKRLTMKVGLAIDPAKSDALATREFMNAIAGGNPQYTGWPAWLDSRGFRDPESRAYVQDGAWQALIVDLEGDWSQHLEFMRLDPTGRFFLRRVMQDDLTKKVEPGTALDVRLMIYRVAEVLAVGTSIARATGWDETARAGFAFQWTGLEGRQLKSWVRSFESVGSGSSKSASAAVESFTSMTVDTPHSALAPYVSAAIGPLFAAFDGYQASNELVEDCVRRLIERKLDS